MPVELNHFQLITAWVEGRWVGRPELTTALREVADQLDRQGGDTIRSALHDPTEGGKTYDLRTRTTQEQGEPK